MRPTTGTTTCFCDVILNDHTGYPAADSLLYRAAPFMFASGHNEVDLPARHQHVLLCDKRWTWRPIGIEKVVEALAAETR